jgi:hypothetical protein
MADNKKTKYEICVFISIFGDQCSECQSEIEKGDFVTRKDDKSFCLKCSDLDRLVFLPKGNHALSLRAGKYSALRAVVLEFGRKSRRQERRGILIEESALKKAIKECGADASERVERREKQDRQYIKKFASQILRYYPSCPAEEADVIAEHARTKYSGRVGRSSGAKVFEQKPIELAVRAHIRHEHTNYDELLMMGWDRYDARQEIIDEVERVIDTWQIPRSITINHE